LGERRLPRRAFVPSAAAVRRVERLRRDDASSRRCADRRLPRCPVGPPAGLRPGPRARRRDRDGARARRRAPRIPRRAAVLPAQCLRLKAYALDDPSEEAVFAPRPGATTGTAVTILPVGDESVRASDDQESP